MSDWRVCRPAIPAISRGQVKTYSYARDDRLLGIAYTGAVNPTPNVGFTWDPYFPRLASAT